MQNEFDNNCYDNIKLDLNPLFKLEHKLFDISLIDDNYFFENNKLYYNKIGPISKSLLYNLSECMVDKKKAHEL